MPTPNSDLVQYIIGRAQAYGDVTPMKLQKILYYVKAWSLVDGHPLVHADFEKWDYGPVNRQLWKQFNGSAPIPPKSGAGLLWVHSRSVETKTKKSCKVRPWRVP